jgi:hypothetical protein
MGRSNPQKRHEAEYFLDAVGRRRKLSAGAMRQIQTEYAHGIPVPDLAEAWGVSTSLVRTVVYSTPRDADVEKMNRARGGQVVTGQKIL